MSDRVERLRRWLPLAVLSTACATSGPAPASPRDVTASIGAPRPALAEYHLDDQLALEGHDPVSYFPEGGGVPQRGSAEHTLRYRGVVYRFASAQNRQTFEERPAEFEPAYGGWCAWAMARSGKRVGPDPENFIIEQGRLRLFYRNAVVNTRDKWIDGDIPALRASAAKYWEARSGEGAGAEPSP